MTTSLCCGVVFGVLWTIGLAGPVAWAQTPAPPKARLERLRVAAAPVGWDTNFTWLHPRSGSLDKRPALEFLVGIDRRTGAYIFTKPDSSTISTPSGSPISAATSP